MLAIERRKQIIHLIESNYSVLVPELSKRFSVTEETIRRDLEKLEKENLLKRTHGGAVLKESTTDDLPFSLRKITDIDKKKQIGALGAELVNDGDTILLDSSSTALQIAGFLKSKKDITVITNSINVVLELSAVKDIQIISTGGILRQYSASFVGAWAQQMVSNYNVDKAFLSCKGIDIAKGITESNELEAEVKKIMVESSQQTILAVDSTKFDQISFVKLLPFSAVHTLITDAKPSDQWLQHLAAHHIEVIYREG